MFLFFNEKMETRQKMETQQKMTCFYFFVKKWKRTRKMEKWRRGPKNGTLEALGFRLSETAVWDNPAIPGYSPDSPDSSDRVSSAAARDPSSTRAGGQDDGS